MASITTQNKAVSESSSSSPSKGPMYDGVKASPTIPGRRSGGGGGGSSSQGRSSQSRNIQSSNGGGDAMDLRWPRNASQEAERGGPTTGDVVWASDEMYPKHSPALVNEIRAREEEYRNLEQAAIMQKAGLMADPSGSGAFISKMSGRDGGRSGGGGLSTGPGISAKQGGKDYWRENYDFQRSLNQEGARQSQQNSLDLNKSQQEQEIKLKILMKLMGSMGGSGGGGRGGDGFTEQIFNNAGAPQVVRLKNRQAGQQSEMLMQLLSGLR